MRHSLGGSLDELTVLALDFSLAVFVAVQPSQGKTPSRPIRSSGLRFPRSCRPEAQLAVLKATPWRPPAISHPLKSQTATRSRRTPILSENVTVISGTLKVGMATLRRRQDDEALGPGSFAYLDPSMHHYAAASGETVIQIHGQSPRVQLDQSGGRPDDEEVNVKSFDSERIGLRKTVILRSGEAGQGTLRSV